MKQSQMFIILEADCIDDNDKDGSQYRGKVAQTISGKTCQRWDAQSPNKHKQHPEEYVYCNVVMELGIRFDE